jgi:hypothetical protein
MLWLCQVLQHRRRTVLLMLTWLSLVHSIENCNAQNGGRSDVKNRVDTRRGSFQLKNARRSSYTSALMVQCNNILWFPLESSVVDLPCREPKKNEWYGNPVHTCYVTASVRRIRRYHEVTPHDCLHFALTVAMKRKSKQVHSHLFVTMLVY